MPTAKTNRDCRDALTLGYDEETGEGFISHIEEEFEMSRDILDQDLIDDWIGLLTQMKGVAQENFREWFENQAKQFQPYLYVVDGEDNDNQKGIEEKGQ